MLGPIGGALIFSALSTSHEGGAWLPLSTAFGTDGLDVSRFICSSTAAGGSFASLLANWPGQLAMWIAMLASMMFPGLSPCGDVAAVCRWRLAPLLLRTGYALPWLVCSTVCSFAQAAALEVGPRAVSGSWTFAGLLIAAGLYQLTPWKQAGLDSLRALQFAPAPIGVIPCLRVGLSMGRSCLISNIGLMTAMAGTEMTSPIVVAGFAAMIAERLSTQRWGPSLFGALLIVAGTLVVAGSLLAR